ncbi:hypothetical protein [Rhodovulum sulfidophilum]|uniref:hypothetical protein n=1 Tax=Rhodovulum sulfidophilum TaxID=35806 RepID=UPI00095191F3|nr:hypothetical protein [Rhodovulum sulfidophilum]MBL3553189.1 hypothetical protein [Rhodovulum sulfidophilum]OLS47228.1 hypothetical protein BV379_02335 [Rhodovulum sulfidophilum]
MTQTHLDFIVPADSDLARLLWHMPTVVSHARSEWAEGFAKSIIRQSRRRNWRPSEKQLGTMRRLVSELFIHPREESEFQVIED